MREGFAESTIVAASWLMIFQPERVPAFLQAHPPAGVLERLAKETVETARRKREAATA